jgi:hypothetical protein
VGILVAATSKRGVIGEGEHGGSWNFDLSSQHFGGAVVAEVDARTAIEPHIRRASLAASVAIAEGWPRVGVGQGVNQSDLGLWIGLVIAFAHGFASSSRASMAGAPALLLRKDVKGGNCRMR